MAHVETEIKLAVRDSRELKRSLKKLGFAVVRSRHFERNALFDFSDLRLRRSGRLLRLRNVNGQSLVTFKGPPLRGGGYKVRREVEFTSGDGPAVLAIFRALGLREVFRYEKYRTEFREHPRSKRAGGPALLYDQTPMGDYLELEGSRRWIGRVARRLGYGRKDYISASYAALYLENCRERGVKPGNMVFKY